MKKCILLLMVLVATLSVSAQNDYVYLKNGSVIKGTIEQYKENSSVTIRTENGQVYTYPMIEVNRVSNGASTNIPDPTNNNNHKDYMLENQGFWCAGELIGGLSCNTNGKNAQLVELDFVGGYRFNEYIRVGLGVGARYYINNSSLRYKSNAWAMPIFANVRGNIMSTESRTIVPYYSVDLGGTIRDGFMFRPTIGVRFGEPRSAFTVGLSYMGQSMAQFTYDNSKKVANQKFTSFVALKLGYEF